MALQTHTITNNYDDVTISPTTIRYSNSNEYIWSETTYTLTSTNTVFDAANPPKFISGITGTFYYDPTNTGTSSTNFVTVSNSDGMAFIVNSDYEATLTLFYASGNTSLRTKASPYTVWSDLTLYVPDAEKAYTITQTLTNCTSDAPSSVTSGESVTITLTANDGYEFSTTPTITGGTFTVADDQLTATATITPTSDVTISAKATAVTTKYNVTGSLTNCTVSPTKVAKYESTLITLTANDGYEFKTAPTATYTYYGYETDDTFTISDSGLTATLTVETESDVTISATATAITTTTTYTITQTLTNCTSDAPSSVTSGESVTITLTADDGYEFSTTPTITGGTFTVADDKLTATATITPTSNVTISAKATAISTTTTYTITQTLTNCTSDAPSSVTSGESVTITLTANDGYEFSTTPTVTGGTFTVADDKLTATATITPTSDVTVSATATAISTTTTYTITQTLTNCTSDAPSSVTSGESVTITLTANDGYEFSTTPTITGGTFTVADDKLTATATITPTSDVTVSATAIAITTVTITAKLSGCTGTIPSTIEVGETLSITLSTTDSYYFDTDNPPFAQYTTYMGVTNSIDFTISSSDAATLTLTITSDMVRGITITAYAATETTYYFGLINVYTITSDNLDTFSRTRFLKASDDGITSGDYCDYVNSLFRLYVNIQDSNLTPSTILNVGKTDLEIPTNVVIDNYIEETFGSVTIPKHNYNAVDLLGTLDIYLPFLGYKTLNLATYLGKKINLVYDISIYTGEALVKLLVNGTIYETYECNLKDDFDFKQSQYVIAPVQKTALQPYYGFEAFIRHSYYLSNNNSNYKADNTFTTISDYTGYIKADEIVLKNDGNITQEEQNEIITLLKEGVYIHE